MISSNSEIQSKKTIICSKFSTNSTPFSTFFFNGKEKDYESGFHYYGSRYYSSEISMWLSTDPMADKYPSLSPYNYCANNPIKLIDPNGTSIWEFDENGNYLRTLQDNWWHNGFVGHKGRIVNSDGEIIMKFKFSDQFNDYADLKTGNLYKIQIVEEQDIIKMLSKSGAFDKNNKVSGLSKRYDYILKEGLGLGKFDFYAKAIPDIYGDDAYMKLYLVDGYAYNPHNFGNFLFGAAGKAIGLTEFELRFGAHFNSLFHAEDNGYPAQFDSPDDQRSIHNGVKYAKRRNYQKLYYKVIIGPLEGN